MGRASFRSAPAPRPARSDLLLHMIAEERTTLAEVVLGRSAIDVG
jgi:hypothetical protein